MIVTKLTYGVIGAFFLCVILSQILEDVQFSFIFLFLLGLNFLMLLLNLIHVMGRPSEKQLLGNMCLHLFVVVFVAICTYLARTNVMEPIFSLNI